MRALRTTYAMVMEAQEALDRADELVEATGVLLADAVLEGLDLAQYLRTYRQAKAQRRLAGAIFDGTAADWHRDRAVSA